MENLVGKNIRGYTLHELIGEGGFGAVYRATQIAVDREVAIKVILPQYANRPDFIRKFEAEAKLIAKLEHIHIVALIDYWRDPEGAFLVLRWMKGGTLKELLREEGAMDPRAAAKLFTQVASALAIAHRNNVVHRDVKPANILLDEEKNGYLSDFGIAFETMSNEQTQGASSGSSTGGSSSGGGVTGSAGYISPEQVNIKPITPRADIYSMTVMLYEMLAGRHPYPDARSAIALFIKHTSEPLPMLENFPAGVNAVLQKGAAKDPEERYSDIMEMVRDLKVAIVQADVPGAAQGYAIDDFDTTSMQPALLSASETVNPYKGLRAFQESDARDFHGREALIQHLLTEMQEDHPYQRFLAVVGPSGSGKSSVVKAGLLPALRANAIEGSQNWFIAEMVPNLHPVTEVEDALLSIAVNPLPDVWDTIWSSPLGLNDLVNTALPSDDDSEFVLVIDQFEEVFTQAEEQERLQFLQNIYEATIAENSRLRVIVTMRADFYDRPLMVQRFSQLMQQRTETVIPLTAEELTRAITEPARRMKIFFQQGLAAQIVSEVSDQPGILPMLQYALTELFERREGQIMTLAAYQELGGVLGALARRAEEIYTTLNPQQAEATRQLFLRLVTLGEGTEDTRRRASLLELNAATREPAVMQQVIDTFGQYRLLTFDRDPVTRLPTIEVAHEALIRQWQRLRTWLDEGREDVRLQRMLTAASNDWDNHGRDRSFLLRGGRLVQFEDWIESSTVMVAELDQIFLTESIAERNRTEAEEALRKERELAQERRTRRLTAIVAVGGVVGAIIGFALAFFALNQSAAADVARQDAVAQASTATFAQGQAQVQANAAGTSGAEAAAQALTATYAQGEAQVQANAAGTSGAEAAAQALTATYAQGEAQVQANAAGTSGAEAVEQALTATVAQGEALISAGTATVAQGEALVLAQTAVAAQRNADEKAATAVAAEDNARREGETARSLALAASAGQLASVNAPLALRLAIEANNVDNPALQARRVLISVVFNAPRQRLQGQNGSINSIAVSPDSQLLYTGSADGTVTIWNLVTGESRNVRKQQQAINRLVLSPTGLRFATASEDGTVIVWDANTLEDILTFEEHDSAVRTLVFNPSGGQIASGDANGNVLVWNTSNGVVSREITSANAVYNLAYSPNGRQLLITSEDLMRTYDLSSGVSGIFQGFDGQNLQDTRRVRSAVFSPDGEFIVSSGIAGAGTPALWTTENLRLWQFLTPHNGPVNVVAYSPDGKLIVTGSDDFALLVSNADDGTLVKRLAGHTNRINAAVFTPDGESIISAAGDGTIFIWDVNPFTAEEVVFQSGSPTSSSISGVNYTPAGNIISTTDLGQITIWNPETRERILQRNLPRAITARSVMIFSPLATEENLLIGYGTDQLRIVNLTTNEILTTIQATEERAFVYDMAFSPDGQTIVWGGGYFYRDELTDFTRIGILRLYDANTGALIRDFKVETRTTRTITAPNGETTELTDILDEGTNRAVTSVAFSPDGRTIAAGFEDGRIIFYDVSTGEVSQNLVGHSDRVRMVRFNRDGTALISGSSDSAIILWDTSTGQLLRRFTGHTGAVNSVGFSRVEDTILSASEDGTLRLWDTQTGESIQRFGVQDVPITNAAFNPNETRALAGTLDGQVLLNNIDTAEGLREWAESGNRYIPELSCLERAQYLVPPLCEAPPTPIDAPPPTGTLSPEPPAPTYTPSPNPSGSA